jgi:hypothetical protein
VNGLKLYEAIVEQKILETTQNQIENFEKMSDQLLVDEKIPEPAEFAVIKETTEKKIAEKKEEIELQIEEIKKDESVQQTEEK